MKAIIGPTASGKTGLAIALAEATGGEIINMDAFAQYRGMDIGTAKPTAAEQARVPHHLIDNLELHETASVADYQRDARAVRQQLEARGVDVFAAGGSALYVRAFIDDIAFPATDPQVRARLEAECETVGAPEMYRRLQQLDQVAAQNMHWNNARKIVRALEVIELTGQPFSATLPTYESVFPTLFIGLRRENEEIDARIELRTKQMFAGGLIEEVEGLLSQGLETAPTASRATGYAEVMALLRGQLTLEEAQEAVALATRQLVRYQMKWFRRDPRVHWIDATGLSEEKVYAQAQQILARQ